MLRQRPDIAQAEQELIAANARIGAAMAQYYPQLSLTGSLGVASGALSNLLTGPAGVWAIAAGLARALAPLVIAIALAASLEKFLPWMEPRDLVSHLVRLALATVIFLPAYIVLTWPFTRGMGLRQLVGELSIPVIGPMLRRFGVVDRGASS